MRISDWSSDVCSSDLDLDAREAEVVIRYGRGAWVGVDAKRIMAETLTPVASPDLQSQMAATAPAIADLLQWPLLHDSDTSQWRPFLNKAGIRSEERRVGKEGVRTCRFRWARNPKKKKHT